jgi:hypothetical protein
MLVTLEGIVIEVNPLHPEKALMPMTETLDGIVTDVNPVHFSNAPIPIVFTLLGINKVVKQLQ